jgi:hypothetical protein
MAMFLGSAAPDAGLQLGEEGGDGGVGGWTRVARTHRVTAGPRVRSLPGSGEALHDAGDHVRRDRLGRREAAQHQGKILEGGVEQLEMVVPGCHGGLITR